MYGYIYKTTNLVNNKIYIGQHKSSVFEPDKYIGSGTLLAEAIKKYGIQNFKNELLCECASQEELDQKEIYFTAEYRTTDRHIGYNITTGGNANTQTTKGFRWVTNGIQDKSIDCSLLDEYINAGWKLGRTNANNKPWNKGKSKATSKKLQKISEIRKIKIANNEINCCFGLKGQMSPNWQSDGYLKQNYLDKGFAAIWLVYGRSFTQKYFKINWKTFNRLMVLAELEETKEHIKSIRSNRFKQKPEINDLIQ